MSKPTPWTFIFKCEPCLTYKEQVREQKKEEVKPVEVRGVEEWEVEKILNKRKVRRVVKYLV